jgi:hypothetical protein
MKHILWSIFQHLPGKWALYQQFKVGLCVTYLVPEVRVDFHLRDDTFFLIVFEALTQMLSKKWIQIYVLVLWLRSAFHEPMCDLRVKDSVAMDLELSDQSACIFAEVVEDLDDISIFQDLFESSRERIDFHQIENVAVSSQANLYLYKNRGKYLEDLRASKCWGNQH